MKRALKLLGALAVVTGLAISGASAQTIFKLSLVGSPGNPETEAAMKFAELVSQKTGGKYRIDVLHSGQAGGEREIAEGLQIGTSDFAVLGGILQNFDPALMIVEWDLLFKNNEHVRAVLNGPIGDTINSRLEKAVGAQKLATFMRTPRLLTTNKPVNTLADLKGMKIRVPEMAARIEIWKALGAQPTPMAFPEVVPALQLGTIDGQENPIGMIASSGIAEAVKYLADTKHLYGFMLLVVSTDAWDKIAEADREKFRQAAIEAAAFNDEYVAKSEATQMEKVTKTMTVTNPDLAPWREAAGNVYKKYASTEGFTDLYAAIVAEGEKH